ncbi:hypothetical protein Leryth_024181 [Lithospermum erythrorhizon]|uniref:IST1-like protein n=1 Tax=Lithospermum erythrorhizon TaxID=34254 RepID=A0AAV3P1A2_LITER|nr:hypothetical protein Leryth_024181 [Lithospermum erythrorhizon]
MRVVSVVMKMGLSIFRKGFNSSKCKTKVKMAVARIKLLRNRRLVVVRQMRRDIALLLQSGQDATARIRVEHVIREQNVLAANEFLELFCELIVSRLTIIAKQRECPADLKEGISSLIFASPRCSDIPELLDVRDVFEKKYGKDFVSAAIDLRPNAGVNRMLIEKLSVRTPSGEVKLKVLKEIAKEYQVDWNTTESEAELLKPPEKLTDGPSTFVSASTFPVNSNQKQHFEQPKKLPSRCVGNANSRSDTTHFKDSASAAEAAAESAKKAIAAAEVAAYLSKKENETPCLNNTMYGGPINGNHNNNRRIHGNYEPNYLTHNPDNVHDKLEMEERMKRRNTLGNVHPSGVTKFSTSGVDEQKVYRRHSYNVPPARSDLKFDESECDEEFEAELPPSKNGLPPDWSPDADARNIRRQHSYNISSANPKVKYAGVPPARSDIKFDESECDEEFEAEQAQGNNRLPPSWSPDADADARNLHRRHSYNISSANPKVKYDESDSEDGDMEEYTGVKQPPNRPAPPVPGRTYAKQDSIPRVHPKLPDYDALAARFEALKYQKSQR